MSTTSHRIEFSDDPEHAWTLPGRYYHDPAVYAREMEHIFHRSWQYVCHVSALAEDGDYFVRDIAMQSVVALRAPGGELRAFHNVCQHRAHRLLEGEGRLGDGIVCPYHAWRYGLDGALRHARGSERMSSFERGAIGLKTVRVDQIAGFVFVNLDDDAAPMCEAHAGLEEEILALAPRAASLQRSNAHTYAIAANWKNSVENYSECYHCPNRHPSLVGGALDIRSYRIHTLPGYHRHITTDVGDAQGYRIERGKDGASEEFGSWLLWPNMVFEVYPGGNLTTFHHVPDGPERTLQQTEWFFPSAKPTPAQQEVVDFVHVVREEDIPICESVQRGLHSLGYERGRLIVDPQRSDISEHAVHDFQRRVLTALGDV